MSSLISAPLWPRATNIAYDSTRSQVLLLGGLGATISNDTWTWNGTVWTRQESTTMPTTRAGAALDDDPQHHVVVMFGGDKIGDYRGDTWLWSGAWHAVCPPHSPSPRTGAAMTYDPVRHSILLFGGFDGTVLNDTWVWNGTDWAEQSPATSPPARQYSRLAFDYARGNAVLFGGFGGLTDTWTWDGSKWTQRHPARTPPGVGDRTPLPEAMVYDSARKVILFIAPVHNPTSAAEGTMETWTWNGTAWTRLTPAASPPPRDGYGLAYDAARSLVVLAGGLPIGTAEPTTTWGWNGMTWSDLSGVSA
ncbi:MAG: hypothetical protein QOG08_1428 [Chloroflexota bacterium]|jgi:hypothetical protein|nr:hypothetical protein [Chloroflexota bacterium]